MTVSLLTEDVVQYTQFLTPLFSLYKGFPSRENILIDGLEDQAPLLCMIESAELLLKTW